MTESGKHQLFTLTRAVTLLLAVTCGTSVARPVLRTAAAGDDRRPSTRVVVDGGVPGDPPRSGTRSA